MPELPEVEHAMRQLRATIVNQTIAGVRVLHPALKRSLPDEAQRQLAGRTVARVERRGKLQLLTLDDDSVLEVHFRMTGDWSFGKTSDPEEKRERGRIELSDGRRVSLIDPRAFAVMRLHAPGTFELPDLGLEPFDDAFTGAVLKEAVAKRTIPIKQALLDQKVLAGIGNIYASEALWEAKIAPTRVANELTTRDANTLAKAIKTVLERAPAGRYYYDGSSKEAEATDTAWRVYDREGEPCARCKEPIERIVQGTRSTFYCPRCQAR